ncbi:signal peptidase II [Actinosynnema sp.]|uniref:signal peptidase II n=1 Tax=Actinosynnema sp. TaxID=1872144 RepID=UPI003F827F25
MRLDAKTTRPTGRAALFTIAAVGAVADLAAKVLAERNLVDGPVDLGPLQLRLLHNEGVAFSLGSSLPAGVVTAVTALITLGVALHAHRTAPSTPRWGRVALALVLGGAVGNLVDRAFDGAVTDYFHTGWFATFNVADVLISAGAVLLVLVTLLTPEPEPAPVPQEPAGR